MDRPQHCLYVVLVVAGDAVGIGSFEVKELERVSTRRKARLVIFNRR